jgi:hypothetical protein
MPKIRDLGINVIPETMRPPEMGPGGYCGGTVDCPTTSPGQPTTGFLAAWMGTCPTTSPGNTGYVAAQTCPTTSPGNTGYVAAQTCPTTSPGNTGMYGQVTPWTGQTCPTTSPTHMWTGQTCPTTSPTHMWTGQTCPTTSPGHPSTQCYGITRELINELKAQLHKQLEQLDEFAKNLGPKSLQAIETREKELQAELEELARLKNDLKPSE